MNDQVKPEDAETFAALDLGSNSFHLIVARYHNQQLQVIDRIREMVRLADGLTAKGRISARAKKRALACLTRLGQRLRAASHVRAVGTNTLRLAHGSDDFLGKAEQALGCKIEVISGFEEARLIYLGVAHSMQPTEQNRLVIDIGGGSTELIVGRAFEPRLLESVELGCVQFSEQYFDGKLGVARFRDAELAARRLIQPQQKTFQDQGWHDVVGASGTIHAVLAVGKKLGLCEHVLSADALTTIVERVTAVKRPQDLTDFGITAERASVFAGGLAILTALFKSLRIKEMQVSDSALREGLLWDMIGRTTDQGIREASIARLARRCEVDEAQAKIVSEMALTFFDAVSSDWNIDLQGFRPLLRFAAMVSEIGLSVSHHQHHKHGAYLFRNSDLAGFSVVEQDYIALLIAALHNKFAKQALTKIAGHSRNQLRKTALLLRLALLFQRDREQRLDIPVTISVLSQKKILLKLKQHWLAQHPLTAHDLGEEKSFWRGLGCQLQVTTQAG